MHKNRSVDVNHFAMVPRAEIPRASFRMPSNHKATFNASGLYPVYVQDVLPGDTFKMRMTAFVRLATPIVPVMDNLWLDSFWFYVPNRLVWENWVKMCGEQLNPGDSTSFVTPQIVSPAGGFAAQGIYDHFGIPCAGQITAGQTISVNALPFRAYNLIWNEWFRDQNLNTSRPVPTGDGPDSSTDYGILGRNKRHDYFTSCLPFLQKGTAVTMPLGVSAPVKTSTTDQFTGAAQPNLRFRDSGTGNFPANTRRLGVQTGTGLVIDDSSAGLVDGGTRFYPTNLFADLSTATAATINQLRQSFQIQRLLERDARGGTRYTEVVLAHFGVKSPDARLQRPEYLGGNSTRINFAPIPQTAPTAAGVTPMGTLAAKAEAVHHSGFSQSFTEHGILICLVNVRADLNYQQGLNRLWTRTTRFDHYWPAFAMLGEQAVLNKEIYTSGVAANDDLVFGYQERWAEYRYKPSTISGYFRSTTATPLDMWHMAERFFSLPALNAVFIGDNTSQVLPRVLALGGGAAAQQLLADYAFDCEATRPMPLFSVPGMIDHF